MWLHGLPTGVGVVETVTLWTVYSESEFYIGTLPHGTVAEGTGSRSLQNHRILFYHHGRAAQTLGCRTLPAKWDSRVVDVPGSKGHVGYLLVPSPNTHTHTLTMDPGGPLGPDDPWFPGGPCEETTFNHWSATTHWGTQFT